MSTSIILSEPQSEAFKTVFEHHLGVSSWSITLEHHLGAKSWSILLGRLSGHPLQLRLESSAWTYKCEGWLLKYQVDFRPTRICVRGIELGLFKRTLL